jgi:hypothetical protein
MTMDSFFVEAADQTDHAFDRIMCIVPLGEQYWPGTATVCALAGSVKGPPRG